MIHDYDTLAFHKKERPGVICRDLSATPVSQMGVALKQALENSNKAHPEKEALTFYLLNHAFAAIQQNYELDEPLSDDLLAIVEHYHSALNKCGARLFYYLLAITTRESRHVTKSQHKKLLSKYSPECVGFTDLALSHAQHAFFETDTNLAIGPYLDYLCDVFNTLTWSSAYGGPAWGKVTETLRDCIYGRISIEMMLDVGYTLAHNNGPIFNKGMFYHTYHASDMIMILDCQRAGQIPNLVRAGASGYVDPNHVQWVDVFCDVIPGFEADPWVNWDIVQKLGAVGNYAKQQKETLNKHKHNPKFAASHAAAVEQAEKVAKEAAEKKALEEKTYFHILPGIKLEKVEKERE